jgi:hypothetical protein
MWSSAVSLVFLAAGFQQQAAQTESAWTRVNRSVVRLESAGQAVGVAVLIDSRGLFLAHRSSIPPQELVVGRSSAGQVTVLMAEAVDEVTGLVLLHAPAFVWPDPVPVRVGTPPANPTRIVAATSVGPVMGEFLPGDKVGQLRPSLRYVPLNEVRLETMVAPVGGAFLFDQRGTMIGVLGATLAGEPVQPGGQALRSAKAESAGSGGAPGAADSALATQGNYGPQGMTVAFTFSTSVIGRVVEGFRSPSRQVKHPSIGVFFKSTATGGAQLEAVLPGTPADKAGLRVGDVVIEADGRPIGSQIDFAVVLFGKNPGETVSLRYRRGNEERTATVTVGAQPSLD